MMWDYETMFSDGQAVAATGSTTGSNIVRLASPYVAGESAVKNDVGPGFPIMVQVQAEGFTGDGTLAITINASDDPAMADPLPAVTVTVPAETLTRDGVIAAFALPKGMKAYAQATYTAGGTLATGGTVTAGLVLRAQTN